MSDNFVESIERDKWLSYWISFPLHTISRLGQTSGWYSLDNNNRSNQCFLGPLLSNYWKEETYYLTVCWNQFITFTYPLRAQAFRLFRWFRKCKHLSQWVYINVYILQNWFNWWYQHNRESQIARPMQNAKQVYSELEKEKNCRKLANLANLEIAWKTLMTQLSGYSLIKGNRFCFPFQYPSNWVQNTTTY